MLIPAQVKKSLKGWPVVTDSNGPRWEAASGDVVLPGRLQSGDRRIKEHDWITGESESLGQIIVSRSAAEPNPAPDGVGWTRWMVQSRASP